ncbi:MAG: SMP-30/gluconolactonase/LRE family protein [bacterium]|nr:SMP-30/gluconolactonase/LRE family protein [bacterium]
MADIEVVTRGLQSPYGLAFDTDDIMYVSESGAGRVSCLKEGRLVLFAQTGSCPRGIAFDDSGDLFVAESGRHHLVLISPDVAVEVYASSCKGRRLVSPEELCFTPTGDVLFSDAGHGAEESDGSVYRADLDGEVTEIISGLSWPAGMILSEDAGVLYVSERGRNRILCLEIDDDGNQQDQQVFVDLKDGSHADCLLFDKEGQLYASVPGEGILVLDPEGATIRTIELPSNDVSGMVFGGLEFNVLFACAGDAVYRIPLEVPGQRPFAGPRSV